MDEEKKEGGEATGILWYRIITPLICCCAVFVAISRGCADDYSVSVPDDVEIPENEDPSLAQLTYCNTAGLNNDFPRECREHAGIKNPPWYKEFYTNPNEEKKLFGENRAEVKFWLLFINGTASDDFDEFKERTMNFFQPKDEVCTDLSDSECDELREANTAIWLFQCALGAYQIRLDWLCQYVNGCDDPLAGRQNGENPIDTWKRNYDNGVVDWKKNFRFIYEFLNSQELQVQASNGHILRCCNDYEGDPDEVGECYYSGSKAKLSLRSVKGQTGGHGSILGYGRKSVNCFKNKVKDGEMECDNSEHLNKMRYCIWGIEGGGKKARKDKYSLKPKDIKKWEERGVIFDADEIDDYEPPK